MAPGQQIRAQDLSYSIAKKVCNSQDFERLACAFLSATSNVDFDANKAAREFGGCKPDSFKRAIWVICKKIKEASDQGNEEGGDDGGGQVKKGGKRKVDGVENEDGDGGVKKKKTRGSGGGKKKKVKEEPGAGNGESGDGEDSDGLGLL